MYRNQSIYEETYLTIPFKQITFRSIVSGNSRSQGDKTERVMKGHLRMSCNVINNFDRSEVYTLDLFFNPGSSPQK